MTDSDDETVIVSASAGNLGNTTYHTDPECPSVKRMDTPLEKPLDVLAGAYAECERCGTKPGPTPSESSGAETPLDGLPPSAKFVRKVLEYEDALTYGELLEETGLAESTVTDALETLRQRDLIARQYRTDDFRTHVYVSKK